LLDSVYIHLEENHPVLPEAMAKSITLPPEAKQRLLASLGYEDQ
jgi:hypothetical protein